MAFGHCRRQDTGDGRGAVPIGMGPQEDFVEKQSAHVIVRKARGIGHMTLSVGLILGSMQHLIVTMRGLNAAAVKLFTYKRYAVTFLTRNSHETRVSSVSKSASASGKSKRTRQGGVRMTQRRLSQRKQIVGRWPRT